MKINKFFGKKVKLRKFSTECENVSKTGGNLKQGVKCIMVSGGMDAPVLGLPRSLAGTLTDVVPIQTGRGR